MKQNLKKLTLSFIVTSIFAIGIYYIISLYDASGNTMIFIESNIQFLVFLYLSIIISLSIYTNKDKKSKLILAIVILINFLYIVFSFGVSNIGLTNIQGLFLIGFLILALISNYINNLFGHTITTISIIGIMFTVGLAVIPMYESGPDIEGFKSQFSTKLIVYSKANINKKKASINIDKKKFNILNGITAHDLKINNSGSQLQFVADKKYLNSFGYLLFSNKEILQIYPQSAININLINNKYQIEIITGIIKQYPILPQNTEKDLNINNNYIITGVNLSFGSISQENTQEILNFYKENEKEYILNKLGGGLSKNETMTNISKVLIEILTKIFPKKFPKNLENFNKFQTYINPHKDNKNPIKFDTKSINKGILKEVSESLENTKVIK